MDEALNAYRTLVVVAVSCGLVIAGAFEGTRAQIAANQNAALRAAITTLLPDAAAVVELTVTDAGLEVAEGTQPPGSAPIYLALDAAGGVAGFAVPAIGIGYQDRIRLLYGYDPRGHSLAGFVVLDSRETPGLGARIGTDPGFLRQFKGLDVSLDPSGRALAAPLALVGSGADPGLREIDGITGATVSSRAVVKILNMSLSSALPRIHDYLQTDAAASLVPARRDRD